MGNLELQKKEALKAEIISKLAVILDRATTELHLKPYGINKYDFGAIPKILEELFELVGAYETEKTIREIMALYSGKISETLKIQIEAHLN